MGALSPEACRVARYWYPHGAPCAQIGAREPWRRGGPHGARLGAERPASPGPSFLGPPLNPRCPNLPPRQRQPPRTRWPRAAGTSCLRRLRISTSRRGGAHKELCPWRPLSPRRAMPAQRRRLPRTGTGNPAPPASLPSFHRLDCGNRCRRVASRPRRWRNAPPMSQSHLENPTNRPAQPAYTP